MNKRLMALLAVVGLILGWWMLDRWAAQLASQSLSLRTDTAQIAKQQARLSQQDWFTQRERAIAAKAAWEGRLYVGASNAHIRAEVASDMQKVLAASNMRAATFKVVERGEQSVGIAPQPASAAPARSQSAAKPKGTEEIAVVFGGAFVTDAVVNLMMLLESGGKAMKIESLLAKGARFEMTVLFLAKTSASATAPVPAGLKP